MKIVINDVAIETNDILRFQKGEMSGIPCIDLIVKTRTKDGEKSMPTFFDDEAQRDATYERLLAHWAGDNVHRI
jgi:hypothetical protein